MVWMNEVIFVIMQSWLTVSGIEISSRPVARGDKETIRATNFWESLALLATLRKKEPCILDGLLKSPK